GSAEANVEFLPGNTNLSFSAAHFRVLSNELGSVRVLVCPADRAAVAAATFASLTRSNISYWVNYRTRPGEGTEVLGGDRNLTNGATSLAPLEVGFNNLFHGGRGNVLFADGHVESRKTFALQRWDSPAPRMEANPSRPVITDQVRQPGRSLV